jgi:hypothetical protein
MKHLKRFNESGKIKTETIINWSNIPKWVKWVAMDWDGIWHMFEKEPFISITKWREESPDGKIGRMGKVLDPTIKNAPSDFKQCKFKRPDNFK